MTASVPTTGPFHDLAWLHSFAARLAREEADDLVQDTLLTAVERAPTDAPSPSRQWLATVMRNRLRMLLRSARTRQAREATSTATQDTAVAPDAAAHRFAVLRTLVEQLETLPQLDREIIAARFINGRNATEIGRQLQLPSGTVRSRLHRSLQRLRSSLDEKFGDDRVVWAAAVGLPQGSEAAMTSTMASASGATGHAVLLSVKVVVGLIAAVAIATLLWLGVRSTNSTPTGPLVAESPHDERPRSSPSTTAGGREAWLQRRAEIRRKHAAVAVPAADATRDEDRGEQERNVQSLVDDAMRARSQAFVDCKKQLGHTGVGALVLRSHVMGAPDIGTIYDVVDVVGETENSPDLVECIQQSMYAFVGAAPSEPFDWTDTLTTLGPRPPDQSAETWRRRIFDSVVTAHLSEVSRCQLPANDPSVPLSGRLSVTMAFGHLPVPTEVRVVDSDIDDDVAECVVAAARAWHFPRPALEGQTFSYNFDIGVDGASP